ncbi:MAG: transglutaminase-like cysteine peptidase [Oxalobacter formigenes]|nr:transglutaminase-like cysteine peptidase [Oxalobacter formigenes]
MCQPCLKKNSIPLFFRHLLAILAAAFLLSALLHAAASLPRLKAAVISSMTSRYGIGAKKRLEDWAAMMQDTQNKPEQEKLKTVNDFFNTIPYISDLSHWKQNDYWATPAEMLASNGGDCEDYAIAKYVTLAALGIGMDKLKITYVQAKVGQSAIAHMVLAYYAQPGAVPLILDNLNRQIKPASQRADLTPVYAFNGSDIWVVKSGNLGRVGNAGKIRFWKEIQNKMEQEFE